MTSFGNASAQVVANLIKQEQTRVGTWFNLLRQVELKFGQGHSLMLQPRLY